MRLTVDLRKDLPDHVGSVDLEMEEGFIVRHGRNPFIGLELSKDKIASATRQEVDV